MHKRPSLFISLIPVVFLILFLSVNVLFAFGDDAVSGANQFILMMAGALAAGLAYWKYEVSIFKVIEGIGAYNLGRHGRLV